MYEPLKSVFRDVYYHDPDFVVRAPGRVNLIGEHTDYNLGYVFPAAIEHAVTMAVKRRQDREVGLHSVTFGERDAFSLDEVDPEAAGRWSDYVQGVAVALRQEGHALCGVDIAFEGTVPIASGLSSSAAMEVAACLALETAAGLDIGPVQRALVCQRAEREFVGVQCGIMDQFISALGKADHALLIDTKTLEYEAVPLPSRGFSLVIGDSRQPRQLAASAYNQRTRECAAAVAELRSGLPGIETLRDVSEADLAAFGHLLGPTELKRARHVVSENARVLRSVQALKAGDVEEFGRQMCASHASLRDDYEVSSEALDAMVGAACSLPGTLGARMTGAGFGGCTVSLVRADLVQSFVAEVGAHYRRVTGVAAEFYVTRAADGAAIVG